MNDDLKFPIIKEDLDPPPKLTMDQYIDFVMANFDADFDWDKYWEQKDREAVDARFNMVDPANKTPKRLPAIPSKNLRDKPPWIGW